MKKSRGKIQTLTIRVPLSLHQALKKTADEEGTTMNQLCIYLLAKGIGEKEKKE